MPRPLLAALLGLQLHNGASLMYIHCMALKIDLFLWIYSNKHDAEVFSGWKQAEQLYLRNDNI